jgi:hypothetical protein
MQATRSSETSVLIRPTLRYIPEDGTLKDHCSEKRPSEGGGGGGRAGAAKNLQKAINVKPSL